MKCRDASESVNLVQTCKLIKASPGSLLHAEHCADQECSSQALSKALPGKWGEEDQQGKLSPLASQSKWRIEQGFDSTQSDFKDCNPVCYTRWPLKCYWWLLVYSPNSPVFQSHSLPLLHCIHSTAVLHNCLEQFSLHYVFLLIPDYSS